MDYRKIKPLFRNEDSLQRKKAIDEFYETVPDDASEHELSTKIAELKLYSEDLLTKDGKIIQPNRIDHNIKELIELLNKHGIITMYSCEGHSRYEQLDGSGPYIKFKRIKNRELFEKLEKELRKHRLIERSRDQWTFTPDVIDNWSWSYRGGKEKFWSKVMDLVTPILQEDSEKPKKRTGLLTRILGK